MTSKSDDARNSETPLRVLMVAPNPSLSDELRKVLPDCNLKTVVEGGDAALKIIPEETPEVIVATLEMNGLDGLSLLEQVRNNPETRYLPFIVLPGLHNRTDLLQCGA